MSTTTATQSKQLTKKELKKFQELLEEKRKAVLDRARQMLSVENMALDTNDLPDEMDLASSEYSSLRVRLRGARRACCPARPGLEEDHRRHVRICEICEEPIGKTPGARPETTLCINARKTGARRAHDG